MKRKAVTRSCAMQCLEGSTLSTALPALNTHCCLQPRLLHNMGNTVSIPSLFSRETTRDNSCNKHGMQQASTASTGVNLVTVLTSVGSLECIPFSHILAKHELQALAPEGYGHCWWHTGLESGGPITRGLQGSKAGRTSPCKVYFEFGDYRCCYCCCCWLAADPEHLHNTFPSCQPYLPAAPHVAIWPASQVS